MKDIYFPKIAIITGPDLRHQFFISQLNSHFPLSAVFIENTIYPDPPQLSNEEKAAWEWFFMRRANYEKKWFSHKLKNAPQNNPTRFLIPSGQINSNQTFKQIEEINPDVIAIFGGSLIGPTLIEKYPNQIINLHVGLPQYYRGSSSNFWPIHDGRIECLGASIHYVNETIDGGIILSEKTIALEIHDDEQTLMGKTIILGTEMMINILNQWEHKRYPTKSLTARGKLFQKKDFTASAILKVKHFVENGQLSELILNEIQKENNLNKTNQVKIILQDVPSVRS